MESLPDDVLFEILVRVPALDVCNSTRLVCRKWYKIIRTRDFRHAHLHRSTCGLVALDVSLGGSLQLTLIATAAGSKADDLIELSKLNYRSQHNVLSSCNGLVLAARRYESIRNLYITNPATDQKQDLPPFFSTNRLAYGCAIAYVASTMEYKVVRAFIRESQDNCVAMLTVGVDKHWTCRVNTQHLSRKAKKLLEVKHPLTTQGFVHWARDGGSVACAGDERKYGHVLTLNVETEIITQFPAPSSRIRDIYKATEVKYLPMGSYLSLLVLRSEFSWGLWEMKPETGVWTEMPSIDLEAQFASSRNYILKPVGWLRPREVLVFSVGERMSQRSRFDSYHLTPFCFAFTVRTRKLQKFSLDTWYNRYLVHRNSLVWINGS